MFLEYTLCRFISTLSRKGIADLVLTRTIGADLDLTRKHHIALMWRSGRR